eukprot:1643070-Amphidinium_carterae.2
MEARRVLPTNSRATKQLTYHCSRHIEHSNNYMWQESVGKMKQQGKKAGVCFVRLAQQDWKNMLRWFVKALCEMQQTFQECTHDLHRRAGCNNCHHGSCEVCSSALKIIAADHDSTQLLLGHALQAI